jgi:hypothetical protein
MPGGPILLAVLAALFVGVSLLVPAGYGLPGPVFGLLALLLAAPALVGGLFIYRTLVRRGDVPPLSEDAVDDDFDPDAPRPLHRAPNRARSVRQVSAFRRAMGLPPIEIRQDEVRSAPDP